MQHSIRSMVALIKKYDEIYKHISNIGNIPFWYITISIICTKIHSTYIIHKTNTPFIHLTIDWIVQHNETQIVPLLTSQLFHDPLKYSWQQNNFSIFAIFDVSHVEHIAILLDHYTIHRIDRIHLFQICSAKVDDSTREELKGHFYLLIFLCNV